MKKSRSAFTLIEMVIVLVIMGILLLMTISLTGNQLQRLQRKVIKESMLSEYQQRYSKNLTSSSFAAKQYDELHILFTKGSNTISFSYLQSEQTYRSAHHQDDFQIISIITNPDAKGQNYTSAEQVTLKLKPYEISCDIGEGISALGFIIRIRDQKDYYLSLSSNTCRLKEVRGNPLRAPEYLLNF